VTATESLFAGAINDFCNKICQERPFRALPKGDALDHLRLAADVHIAASAQAYRREDAEVDS
jgi:hypothetical protein